MQDALNTISEKSGKAWKRAVAFYDGPGAVLLVNRRHGVLAPRVARD
jgi:hypothetical protein